MIKKDLKASILFNMFNLFLFNRKRKGGIMLDEEKTNTQEELKEDTYNKELATSIQQVSIYHTKLSFFLQKTK